MKKIYNMFGVLILSMVLVGCGGDNQEVGQVNNSDGNSVVEDGKSLLGMSKTQKCILKKDGKVAGVIYTDHDKMRSETTELMDGKSGKVLMINDGVWVYTWEDQTKKGMKMKNVEMNDDDFPEIPEMNIPDEYLDQMDGEMEEVEDDVDFQCEKWSVDSKMFIPPTNVEFQDINQMLESMKGALGDGDSSGICDLVPEAEQADCLKDLSEAKAQMQAF
jgi:hypothetical protein